MRVTQIAEEPVLPAGPATAGQLVGVGGRVVVDIHIPGKLVRAVEPAAILDVADARGIRVRRLPLGQDRLECQVIGKAVGIVVGIAGDQDIAAGLAGDRVLALTADQDAAARAACDRVSPGAADENVALSIAGQGVTALPSTDVADVGDSTASTGCGTGSQVDRNGCRVRRVVKPIVAPSSPVDLAGNRFAGAEDENIDSAAAREILDPREGHVADITRVGAGDLPGAGDVRADQRVVP